MCVKIGEKDILNLNQAECNFRMYDTMENYHISIVVISNTNIPCNVYLATLNLNQTECNFRMYNTMKN